MINHIVASIKSIYYNTSMPIYFSKTNAVVPVTSLRNKEALLSIISDYHATASMVNPGGYIDITPFLPKPVRVPGRRCQLLVHSQDTATVRYQKIGDPITINEQRTISGDQIETFSTEIQGDPTRRTLAFIIYQAPPRT